MTPAQELILIVDSDINTYNLLASELVKNDFAVKYARNIKQAEEAIADEVPHVVLIDPSVNGENEMDSLVAIRNASPNSQVVILSDYSKDNLVRNIKALNDELATDFIYKRFNPSEVRARINSILRYKYDLVVPEEDVTIGEITVSADKRTIRRNGKLVALSRTETNLFFYLFKNRGRVCLNNEVLVRVWGPDYQNEYQYLRVWLFRLRGKIETDPSKPMIIKTLPGIGIICDEGVPALVGAK